LRTEIWGLLGIPETFDKAAIRRAYAARMRTIDMETGQEAFVALRAAYEAALAYEDEAPYCEFDEADDSGPGPDDQAAPDSTTPAAAALRAFLDDLAARPRQPRRRIEDIVASSGAAGAWPVFRGWLANGDISIGEQTEAAALLLSHAVKDEALPRETFIEMTKVLGVPADAGRFDNHPGLNAAIEDRLAVYKWFDRVKADAASKPRGKRKHIIRAARALLRRDRKFPRRYATMRELKLLIDTFRSHESLLAGVIEPEFLARLDAHTKKMLWYWDKFILTWFGMVAITMLGDLLFQLCRDAIEAVSGWFAH